MLKDFIEILLQCVSFTGIGILSGVVLLSLALGALCWIACSYYTRLWNKRFHVKLRHHLLCGIAALLTVIFTVLFYTVGNLEFIVNEMIDSWNEKLVENAQWHTQTYTIAFYAVKEQYPGEFRDVPEPGRKNSYIPFNNNSMIQTCVETYVNEACANFSTMHPLLDKMLSVRSGISEEKITKDIQDYFRTRKNVYPLNRAIVIAARHIRESLLEQSPKTVWKTRLILAALFLAVQLIPFGTIGYCAYKDLKPGGTL